MTGIRKWLGFYGDDFTGSTDAMEALTLNGVKTILFLQPPTDKMFEDQRFLSFKAIGIAGVSRALDPVKMETELSKAFEALKKANVRISHYKTCSTFDSSPEVGSIGKAIVIGQQIFRNSRYIPLVVGVPVLKRYTVFGNHFATMGSETYRLDRHPIMAFHPITPMAEGDLRIHLSKQTDLDIQSMTILDLEGASGDIRVRLDEKIKQNPSVILFDVLNEEMLTKIGCILTDEAQEDSLFTVGSSGIEYALASAWKQKGLLESTDPNWPNLEPAEPLLVISGSCSPITEKQIKSALSDGFIGIKASCEELIHPDLLHKARANIIQEAKQYLDKGKSVVVYTALGSEDSSIGKTKAKLIDLGQKTTDTSKNIGEQLGFICKELIQTQGLKRVLVAGGDTSGYVLKELEILAMEIKKPIIPGVPLCTAYSDHPIFDGLEIALKGGQMGGEDFFLQVRDWT